MTDRQTTASDVAATIDQIEQALAESADVGHLTMNGIEHLLGSMYQKAQAASDQQAMQVINDTWGSIQSLAQHSQHNREAALTMTEIAATMRNQRDNVIKDLETLTKAVEYMDSDHPLVSDLMDSVMEANNEEAMMWYDEQVEGTIFSQLQDVFHYDADYNEHIEIFLEIFRLNLEVQPNRKREFYAWLKAVEADNQDGDDDE